jgi:hypothetical protein
MLEGIRRAPDQFSMLRSFNTVRLVKLLVSCGRAENKILTGFGHGQNSDSLLCGFNVWASLNPQRGTVGFIAENIERRNHR